MNKAVILGITLGLLIVGMIIAPLSIENIAEAKRLERMVFTETVESTQDPGQGHETHQIAVLLPPEDGVVYSGRFSYSASVPVEVVVLHEMKTGGKPTAIYTIDGKKEWTLSLIFHAGDKGAKSASMSFVGSALSLHTLDGTEFTATISLHAQARTLEDTKTMPITADSIKEIPYPEEPTQSQNAIEHKSKFWPPKVVKVTDDVYSAIGYGLGNIIMVEGDDGIIIFDVGDSYEHGEEVLNEFRKITEKPVAALIYSHNHLDHVQGAGAFVQQDENVDVYAHESLLANYYRVNGVLAPLIGLRSSHWTGAFLPEGLMHT